MEKKLDHTLFEESVATSRERISCRGWLAWAALAWLVFQVVYSRFVAYTGLISADAYLVYMIMIGGMSLIAVMLLTLIPRGKLKVLTIPSAVLLVVLLYFANAVPHEEKRSPHYPFRSVPFP